MKKFLLSLVGVYRVHHIQWSFGWKLPFGQHAYFPQFGWRRVVRRDYHDCRRGA